VTLQPKHGAGAGHTQNLTNLKNLLIFFMSSFLPSFLPYIFISIFSKTAVQCLSKPMKCGEPSSSFQQPAKSLVTVTAGVPRTPTSKKRKSSSTPEVQIEPMSIVRKSSIAIDPLKPPTVIR